MANTFELIASVTVTGGGVSSIDFNSISSAFTDLVLLGSCRTNRVDSSGVDSLYVKFNGVTTNQSAIAIRGAGSGTPASYSESNIYPYVANSNATASTYGNFELYIPNYTSTVAKSTSLNGVSENNTTQAFMTMQAGRWNPATNVAITSISLYSPASATIVADSNVYLYGVKNA